MHNHLFERLQSNARQLNDIIWRGENSISSSWLIGLSSHTRLFSLSEVRLNSHTRECTVQSGRCTMRCHSSASIIIHHHPLSSIITHRQHHSPSTPDIFHHHPHRPSPFPQTIVRHTDPERLRQPQADGQIQTDSNKLRQTQTDSDRLRQTQRDSSRLRQAQTGAYKLKQTQTDSDRQSETNRHQDGQTDR